MRPSRSTRNTRGWKSSIAATKPTASAPSGWLTDRTRPFVIVLIETAAPHDAPLGPLGHLGVACGSRAEVDRLCAAAQAEGRLPRGAIDNGPPIGYTAFLADPDGNPLELSYGQEVGPAVARATAL
jgi:lactoylglutathione lyase